ncbi:hypothetical protein GCM10009017_26920 [Halarchaeum rubridurum]|uniref:Uncharacterized protein n=1 Tax=Halarchaeum rubridurum TaxID=489911 RepID=A0A830G5Q3_9EURY|nr:hypothetical protein GCM10009017_26920 [Halarchaeum rubridurum]
MEMRSCVLADDQSVTNVARSAPVRSDGFRRATEPLVEHFCHRMAFRPQVVDHPQRLDGSNLVSELNEEPMIDTSIHFNSGDLDLNSLLKTSR